MDRIRKLAGVVNKLDWNTPQARFLRTQFRESKRPRRQNTTRWRKLNPLDYDEKPPDPITNGPLSESPESVVVQEGHGPETATKYAPSFMVPIRVLDLDAEDSPYVRPFDQETDGLEQRLKWAVDPLLEELKAQAILHHREFNQEAAAMSRTTKEPFAPQALSDHDIFKVALLGTSASQGFSKDAPHSTLRPIQERLRDQGVPQSILDQGPVETIPFMLHRQRLAAKNMDKDARSVNKGNPPELMHLGDELDRSRNLSELRLTALHLSSPLLRPYKGGNVMARLHQCLKQDHYPLEDLEKTCDQPSTVENWPDFLKFVNNFTISWLLHGHRVRPNMALFALQLASRHGIMPSILQYLQIFLSLKRARALLQSFSAVPPQITRKILVALRQAGNLAVGTRQQLLRLLLDVVPDPTSQHQSLLGSPADYRKRDPERYQLCLQVMGQLGALRLLWRAAPDSDDAALVDAFHRFAQLVSGVKGLDLTTTGDSAQTDFALDAHNMNTIDAHGAQSTLHGSSSDTPISDNSERLPSEEIIAAFREQHISDAMRRFRQLIRGAAKGWNEHDLQQGERTERAGMPIGDVDDGSSKVEQVH